MYGYIPKVPNVRYWRSATQYHLMVTPYLRPLHHILGTLTATLTASP